MNDDRYRIGLKRYWCRIVVRVATFLLLSTWVFDLASNFFGDVVYRLSTPSLPPQSLFVSFLNQAEYRVVWCVALPIVLMIFERRLINWIVFAPKQERHSFSASADPLYRADLTRHWCGMFLRFSACIFLCYWCAELLTRWLEIASSYLQGGYLSFRDCIVSVNVATRHRIFWGLAFPICLLIFERHLIRWLVPAPRPGCQQCGYPIEKHMPVCPECGTNTARSDAR